MTLSRFFYFYFAKIIFNTHFKFDLKKNKKKNNNNNEKRCYFVVKIKFQSTKASPSPAALLFILQKVQKSIRKFTQIFIFKQQLRFCFMFAKLSSNLFQFSLLTFFFFCMIPIYTCVHKHFEWDTVYIY